jgi:hypothetical protein
MDTVDKTTINLESLGIIPPDEILGCSSSSIHILGKNFSDTAIKFDNSTYSQLPKYT